MISSRTGILILGNQLFSPAFLGSDTSRPVFMCEDFELCTYVRHHQQKIVLFLAAMRAYADELRSEGFKVEYQCLSDAHNLTYEDQLSAFCQRHKLETLEYFEIEDHFFAERIADFCETNRVRQVIRSSPMFISSRKQFVDFLAKTKRPFMADFYKAQRRGFNLLLEPDGSPRGGKWSFDTANRKKLPRDLAIPVLMRADITTDTREVIEVVKHHFSDHPGDAEAFWWPVTRTAAHAWLDDFVQNRLATFGPYQDAIVQRTETAFHSVLSPLLNIGLLDPMTVIEVTLRHADQHDVPLNSLEGFVRQIIGWREFIRGIYHNFDEQQRTSNHWGHHRHMTRSWYTGDTGLPPLDHAIKTALSLGWTHHINRLMVIGNLMNLSEIEPGEVHSWFMETHVDSSDWVMGPNVYGMALFSDGGVFATKPYICGSNYLLKMSDFGRGEWCDVVDGLYWRFIEKNRSYLGQNHRMSMMVRAFDKLKPERKQSIFVAAEAFLKLHTRLS